jgi:hypothetical protein
MQVRVFSFLLLVLSYSTVIATEVMKFDIQLFGDKIGEMTITKEVKPNGEEYYLIESYSKAKILWITRYNKSHYEFTFKEGKLIATQFTEEEGGKLSRWGNMKWDGKQYVVSNHKGKKTFTKPPIHSIPSIYFTDGKKIKRIYYDSEAEFVNVEHPDENTLEFKTSDGHRNVYHYINGKLHHLEVHISIATVKMVRVN